MKYKLQDFEEMHFVTRPGGGHTRPASAKVDLYKGRPYLMLSTALVKELNLKTDIDGRVTYAMSNWPAGCIQLVFNPINKNVKAYKLQVKSSVKFTNTELMTTFLDHHGLTKLDLTGGLDLVYEVTFQHGKMLALEISKRKI